MSAQRTPGNWQITSHFERGCGISNGIQGVATAYGINNDEAKANARLIAAAPELLEALQGFMRNGMDGVEEYESAVRALTKALGKFEA